MMCADQMFLCDCGFFVAMLVVAGIGMFVILTTN